MSVQAITSALSVEGVTSAEKFLLVVLANYCDQNMQCWPSQARLAADMNVSVRKMVDLFKKLEDRGLVSREARSRRSNGARNSHMITLNLHSANSALRHESNVQISSNPTCKNGQTHSAESALKPSEEPPIEPSTSARALAPHECAAPPLADRKELAALMADLAAGLKGKARDPPAKTRRAPILPQTEPDP